MRYICFLPQAFFERFVSRTPIPASVWAEETRRKDPGFLMLCRPEDDKVSARYSFSSYPWRRE